MPKTGAEKKSLGSSKSKLDGNEGEIFGKFVSFLTSPVWSIPVISFMEQHCIAFDKDTEHNNETAYKTVHTEYVNMVDGLIECFCDDIGIEPKMVGELLQMRQGHAKGVKVSQAAIEPVVAAQDFNVFVHMMARKNIELQLQALQMIEFMFGIIPAVLTHEGMNPKALKNDLEGQEKLLLIQIINQSKEDAKQQSSSQQKESSSQKLAQTKPKSGKRQTATSSATSELKSVIGVEQANLEKAKIDAEKQTMDALKNFNVKDDSEQQDGTGDNGASQGNVEKPSAEEKDAINPPVDIKHVQRDNEVEMEGIMKMDKAARAEYLKQQRDKLVALKRQAREKAMEQAAADAHKDRPRTANRARAAMRGRGQHSESELGTQPDASVLAARRSLVAKLKMHLVEEK